MVQVGVLEDEVAGSIVESEQILLRLVEEVAHVPDQADLTKIGLQQCLV